MSERNSFRLTERLQMIAAHVEQGECVADIGTDHGYIPIRLLSEGIAGRVILTDLREGPLLKARKNFRRWLPDLEPEFRQGAGLSVLKPGEADVLIIAGMGGILISRILAAHPEIVNTASRLVLQPRNHAFTLRAYLRGLESFVITEEQIAAESRHYCEIITLTRRDLASEEQRRRAEQAAALEARMNLGEAVYDEVPVMYVLTGAYPDYLEHKCETERQVIRNILANGKTEYASDRRRRAEARLEAFETMKHWQERMAEQS